MKLISIVIFSTLLALVSCAASKPPIKTTILNPSLLKAKINFQQSWNKKRSKLEFGSHDTAENCAEYTKLVSRHKPIESTNNQLIKSEYLVCDVLKILSDKQVKTNKSLLDLGTKLSEKLDLRSFPSSLFRVSDETKHTLKSIGTESVTSIGTTSTMETEDWIFRLEVVAITDINGNNKPDWIIWFSDEAKQGNYRSYSTLVAYDVLGDKKITAMIYP